MNERSETSKLERLRCLDESKELQDLLQNNLNLILGGQIDPENPRHWLLIKREMPVPDPSTGEPRWSIDFVISDQFGIPTLVECKRCNDPRARREVVGQMLEYAANGQYYWSSADLRKHAEQTHGGEEGLEAKLTESFPQKNFDAESYFSLVERNLREAKLRLIFFLEESSSPLRSIVDFLNKQMKETEVYLVEARQYKQEGSRVVVPWLFGYTEEARIAKRESREETLQLNGSRGPEGFWEGIAKALHQEQQISSLRHFIDTASETPGCLVRWVKGCTFRFPAVQPNRSLFGVRRNGALELYFADWNRIKRSTWQASNVGEITEEHIAFRKKFAREIGEILGREFTEELQKSWPQVRAQDWLPAVPQLERLVKDLASQK